MFPIQQTTGHDKHSNNDRHLQRQKCPLSSESHASSPRANKSPTRTEGSTASRRDHKRRRCGSANRAQIYRKWKEPRRSRQGRVPGVGGSPWGRRGRRRLGTWSPVPVAEWLYGVVAGGAEEAGMEQPGRRWRQAVTWDKWTATNRTHSRDSRLERVPCAYRARLRERPCMCGRPTHFGPNNVAHIGPNLLVSDGPAGHHITPHHAWTAAPCTPRWGEAVTAAACWLHRHRCRWRREGWATACGRTVAVRLAQRLMPIAAGCTVRRAIAPQRRSIRDGAEQVSCLL
jgi:hypothetical protein